MPGRPVGIATTATFAGLDGSWPLLRAAIEAEGLDPVPFTWDGEVGPPPDAAAVLVNYAWGYVSDRDGFLAWAERTAATTRLLNPLPVLRWNSDKTYVADLAAAGVATVPTAFAAPGRDWTPPSADSWSSRRWAAAAGCRPATSTPMPPPREGIARRRPHRHGPALSAFRGRRRGDRHALL